LIGQRVRQDLFSDNMQSWKKILFVGLLVAFAAGSTVQTAQAVTMDVQMSLSDDAGGGCPKCPDGTDGAATGCSSGCAVPSVALVGADLSYSCVSSPGVELSKCANALTDWRTPPDPYPPKHAS
jgi:hypothetical protein